MTTPIRVFLLDDHEVVRQGLLRLIDADPDMTVVGEASTVAEALVRAPWRRPTWRSWTSGCPTAAGSRCVASSRRRKRACAA